MAKVLITGITGQDGSFLAEQALANGDDVFGIVRRTANPNYWRIQHLLDKITILNGDVLDLSCLISIISQVKPDQLYNLAAQSDVAVSFQQPIFTANVTGIGALHVLEAVKIAHPATKVYQASSSEMFGLNDAPQQNELTTFHPRSPYGCAKLFAHNTAINYRESFNLFVSTGILFNHESERRGIGFVTRKISTTVAEIYHGRREPLLLGDITVSRDWGFAGDYTRAMRLILQHHTPDDFVVATGETWTVTDFLERAFAVIDENWEDWVCSDSSLLRPADIPSLCGDYSKAKKIIGWEPTLSFDLLVERMVERDIERYREKIKNKSTNNWC